MKRLFTLTFSVLSVFIFYQHTYALVYNVTAPTGTNEVYIAGDFTTNAWSPKDRKLTKLDDTHFTIDIPEATTTNQYKYCSGPDWVYVEKTSAGAEVANRTYAGGNDVVAKWSLVYNPTAIALPKTVTINVTVPIEVLECYITGTFNNWAIPTDSTKMTLIESTANSKVYSVSFFTTDANKLQYKFCAGPSWDYASTAVANINYPDPASNIANETISSFIAYYNPATANIISITATVPSGTERVWIQGSMFGWDWAAALEATKTAEGVFKVSVPVSTSPFTIQYLMFNQPDLYHYEVDESGAMRTMRTATYPSDSNIQINVTNWAADVNGLKTTNNDHFKVYTHRKSIIVEGARTNINILNISGCSVESSRESGIFYSGVLKPGLYLVVVDGSSRKIMLNN